MDHHLLRRHRLAAQGLSARGNDLRAAVRAVVGVQAQDVRAAGLALRSRVRGIVRADVERAPLVRTWLFRGTVHLVDPDDLPWLHALFAERNRQRFDALMRKRGSLEAARAMLPDMVEALDAQGPMTRAALLDALNDRGHPSLGPYAVNVVIPWAAAHGVLLGLPDGRFRAAGDLPPPVDPETALATLATRYLAGYGPAEAADLAKWSGLPVTAARRGLAAAGGVFDGPEPPPVPRALLLAAFDTLLLGYRTRELFVSPADERRVLPGGGMLKPVVLVDGRAAGTWRLAGRRVVVDPFGPHDGEDALREEADDVVRFLQL